MKTFADLEFKPRESIFGIQSRMDFDNGFGVSVIKGEYSYGGKDGLYELAVMKNGYLTYDTPITDDVLGDLTPDDVTEAMAKVQQLSSI
jgi:hypothetical protein